MRPKISSGAPQRAFFVAVSVVLGLALLTSDGVIPSGGLSSLSLRSLPLRALAAAGSSCEEASGFAIASPAFARVRPSLAISTFIGGGLTNQRLRLRQFLVLAAVKRLAVFLPDVSPSREAFVSDFLNATRVGWHRLPFGDVFDAPRLAACVAEIGVEVLGVCGAHTSCPLPVTENSSTPLLELMGSDTALRAPSGHVFLGGAPIFEQRFQDAFVADAVDMCITYAPPLRAAAVQVWAAFLAAWRPASATVGLHVRFEDDGAAFFGRGEMSPTMYRAAMLDRIANCVRTLVPPERGAPQELALYVASGEPLSSLQGFLDDFPRTSTKDSLAPPALTAIAHLFGDAAAGVDHLVLVEADYFFGYYESTFSLQVANERYRRGRPSALHNAPWQQPMVCVPHLPFRNW